MTMPTLSCTVPLRRLAGFAGTAGALALLTGCAGGHPFQSASARADTARLDKAAVQAERTIARSEQAVQRAPRDSAARAALGQAYLVAGRFQSAATALDDAMTLGDNSGRTALALALAKIGSGRQREAVALLDDWRSEIPASDLGLALALAGETSRGVAILADAVRGGESTPKLRQNLAYAYALDGRWAEARLMAAQDVPAAELERRIAIWALSTLPDRNQDRVAGLIGAPMRSDPGQPAALALKLDPASEQMAVEVLPAPLPAAPAPIGELPALASAQSASAQSASAQSTAAQSTPAQAVPAVLASAPQHAAMAEPNATVLEQNLAAQSSAPVPTAAGSAHGVRVSVGVPRPSVASAFAPMTVSATAVAAAGSTSPKPVRARIAPKAAIAVGGTHVVQLGAFSSQQGARRAWGIFVRHNPTLSAYRMTITTGTVRGRQIWRVAAGGLNGQGATGLCSQLRSSGGACFAYALPTREAPVPFGPTRDLSGPQRARR